MFAVLVFLLIEEIEYNYILI